MCCSTLPGRAKRIRRSRPVRGRLRWNPLARPIADVEVWIGGKKANVYFAGLVDPFVGLMQMNVEVPLSLAAGQYEVELLIGGKAAGKVGMIWVQ
ncbi:MAG: hypothetical protein R2724_23585 [Bryobacterales bacterium]